MKVVHVSASDRQGGAAIAAYRLHQALRAHGVGSQFLVLRKQSQDETVEEVKPEPLHEPRLVQSVAAIESRYVHRNRTELSNTHFSLSLLGCDLSAHPAIQSADVIHLHWVSSFQTPATLGHLLAIGKPVVWTLHDLASFTGGCHFPSSCHRYCSTCSACPQLRSDSMCVPAAVLRDKRELWSMENLTLVAPSQWMADRVRGSALFRAVSRVAVIPHGIDSRVFSPVPRREARAALGIPLDGTVLLAGADHGEEKRKGFPLLERVFSDCIQDPRFKSADGKVLWVGAMPDHWAERDWPMAHLGRVEEERRMALVYSAADIFVLPSLEDNLPNMLLESLGCAIPVVAFGVGGIPEVLRDGWNGHVVSVGDEGRLQQAILSLASGPLARRTLGQNGRDIVATEHSYSTFAARHSELYHDLLADTERKTIRPKHSVPVTDAQTGAAAMAMDPGPAISALFTSLANRCMNENADRLQFELQASQAESEARQRVIEQLQAHCGRLDAECGARLDLIHRLEAECVARLDIIHRLEARSARRLDADEEPGSSPSQRNRLARGLGWIRSVFRVNNWWFSKLPPLLATACVQILLLGITVSQGALLLGCVFFSIVCVASYGHVVNDLFDVDTDARAGKPNAVARLGRRRAAAICVALVGAGFLPTAAVDYSPWGFLLLSLNYLWPTIYSLPGIRLKERGIWGVLCDAAGSHVTPTLFVLTVFARAVPSLGTIAIAIALVGWSCVLGIKGILNHQAADRECDAASGTTTLVGTLSPARLERFMPRYNVGLEFPYSLAVVLAVLECCPLAAVGLLFYGTVELIKYRLGFQFALNDDPRNTRASVPFANDFFYEIWFPLAVTTQLVLANRNWAWFPILCVLLFFRNFRVQAGDLLAVVMALRCRLAHQYR